MAELTFQQISELVTSMDNDFSEIRKDALARYDLYRMRREPYVDEEIAREGKMRMLSPLLIYTAESIRADIMMNPTEFTVVPLARERDGTVSRTNTQKAENLERAMATLWARLNEGRRVDRDIIWHQLVSPYAVMILEFLPFQMPMQPEGLDDKGYMALVEAAESKWLPWNIYLPDPLTCSWLESNGKPNLFARRYKMLVRDVEELYNKNANSVNPDGRLVLETDKWKWVSDDYRRDQSSAKLAFEEVEVLWLDDGVNIYQAIMAPGTANENSYGEVVSCVPNPTGRCTGFIVPGNVTPDRRITDRYEPFLLPLMQAVMQLNDVRSTRATTARNLGAPRQYIPIDPELSKVMIAKGEKMPTEMRWRKNMTPYTLGKVENAVTELSPDYDKLEKALTEEMQKYLPSPFTNVVDPAVVKSATATSILHAAEAGMRVYGPLMAMYDAAIYDVCESILMSMKTYYTDDTVKLYAMGDEMAGGRSLKAGSYFKLTQQTIDFLYRMTVRTRGMSRAQASAQYEAVLNQWILPDGSKGPATMDDLIDAANYTDPIEQKMKLATESILRSIDPWLQEMALNNTRNEIFLETGEQLPIGTQPGQPGQPGGGEQQPSGMPNNAQSMAEPMITGPSGGSSPIQGNGK